MIYPPKLGPRAGAAITHIPITPIAIPSSLLSKVVINIVIPSDIIQAPPIP